MGEIKKFEWNKDEEVECQYDVPLFKGHTLIDTQTAMIGGRFPSCGYVTIRCKRTNKQFNMGYSSPWDEEKCGYSEYEYQYKYCPMCGELLKEE